MWRPWPRSFGARGWSQSWHTRLRSSICPPCWWCWCTPLPTISSAESPPWTWWVADCLGDCEPALDTLKTGEEETLLPCIVVEADLWWWWWQVGSQGGRNNRYCWWSSMLVETIQLRLVSHSTTTTLQLRQLHVCSSIAMHLWATKSSKPHTRSSSSSSSSSSLPFKTWHNGRTV